MLPEYFEQTMQFPCSLGFATSILQMSQDVFLSYVRGIELGFVWTCWPGDPNFCGTLTLNIESPLWGNGSTRPARVVLKWWSPPYIDPDTDQKDEEHVHRRLKKKDNSS